MKKKISVAGVGMNGFETMPLIATEAVKSADVLIGAKRMTDLFKDLEKPVFVSYNSGEIAEFIRSCEYKNAAVLMSGDCGFYSGTEKLLAELGEEADCTVYGGISSPVYFCAKLKIPWYDMKFVSLHGRNANIVRSVSSNRKTFFLLGGNVSVSDVCGRLCEYGLDGVKIYIGEDLGCESEKISIGTARDFSDAVTSKLSVMIAENDNCERSVRSCIPDGEFIRGSVPMTKAEVRGVCVSKLEIGSSDICWDIGSGTGSVSVEMALRCERGKVYAVEKKPEAVNLTDENRRKFRCDNIEIISGDAEETVEKLPRPDCVFIGGSGGKLGKIISAAYEKNPRAKIIVTAVSLETLGESVSIFNGHNAQTEVTQIAVTRTRKIGAHTMMNSENPIFIIRGEKLE